MFILHDLSHDRDTSYVAFVHSDDLYDHANLHEIRSFDMITVLPTDIVVDEFRDAALPLA